MPVGKHRKATGNNPFLCFFSPFFFLRLRYDFIEIRDGTSENADVLGRHCSNIAPAPIISSGPSLQIRFVSDYAHQGAGFSLRYEIFKTGEVLDELCQINFEDGFSLKVCYSNNR